MNGKDKKLMLKKEETEIKLKTKQEECVRKDIKVQKH